MFRDRTRRRRLIAVSQATAIPKDDMGEFSKTRLIGGYLAVTAFLIAAIGASIAIGSDRHAEPAIGGFYSSSAACLGDHFKPLQSGQFIDLSGSSPGTPRLRAVCPEAKDYLFPPDIVPLLSGAAQIGLAFYLFLVGMELDPRILRERIGQAAFISNTSVAFPMALGFLVAIPIYKLLSPDIRYLPFALFMGVAMSITAFPVLARLLIERLMLRKPVGALAMAGAAIDDVTAWGLLALATAVAGTGKATHALQVIILACVFTAAM